MVLICFSIWFINGWLTSLYFFCNSLKISIDYKWYRHLLTKVGEFQDVIIFLRNVYGLLTIITIQLVLWLFSISSLLKHCRQYIQKCFLCGCFVWLYMNLLKLKYIMFFSTLCYQQKVHIMFKLFFGYIDGLWLFIFITKFVYIDIVLFLDFVVLFYSHWKFDFGVI